MDCTFMTLGGVLKDFYVVPEYQRDYVWLPLNVEELLDDITSNIESAESVRDSTDNLYFIGSIVVFTSKGRFGNKFILIDGQQRMTTIFLVLCAIKARLDQIGDDIPDNLNSALRTVQADEYGNDANTYRIELNYEQNQGLLELAFEGSLSDDTTQVFRKSQRNILNAYNCIEAYLKEKYPSAADLKKFARDIREEVGLVRIEANDLQKAMIVFETLNHRGVGLDSFDLLKNMLYSHTETPPDTDQLTQVWQQIKTNLDRKGIKPMRFLRYFIVSIDESLRGSPPTEKSAFSWFQDEGNKSKFQIHTRPIEFARKIADASDHYKRMLFDNVNHHRERSKALDSMNCLAGASVRQHMGLLLTAVQKNCPSNAFEVIVECIESALFYSFSTRLRSQVLEAYIAGWTVELQRITEFTSDRVQAYASRIKGDMSTVTDRFYADFDSFGQEVVSQRYRQRYILAKYLQFSEKANNDSKFDFLSEIIDDSKIEIEHVFPQKPSDDALSEFGLEDQDQIEQSIGLLANLLLMEGGQQKAGSNKPYSEKRSTLADSKFWMVKKFANPTPNATARLREALGEWPTHDQWNLEQLQRRQVAYKDIAKKIWNFGLPVSRQ
ncbi:MAG: DUF262 domain-containing HNH endonuclease family protein [Gammaproteobacteria bacterium]|nr:DUF262 domain-containing HNH endonuclease family protein [Gammaproteobacteria bacterium]